MSATTHPKKKHQVQAPNFKKIPDEERKNLDVWGEDDGWCSACRAEYVRVAHIGSEKRLINVALCGKCLARMTQAMGAS